jgi:uncharacterized protein (DUF697 family)
MRKRYPKLSVDQLHENLVRAKCVQAGVIGAVSTLTGSIPGVGSLAGRVLGPLADPAAITALQAELVGETFALYEIDLPEAAERLAVTSIAATHAGARAVGHNIGKGLSERIRAFLPGPLAMGALPLAKVVGVAASDIAVTYAIGSRARELAKLGTSAWETWPEMIRAITAFDDRKLVGLATRAVGSALNLAGSTARFWLTQLDPLLPAAPTPKRRAPRKRHARAGRTAP